MESRRSLKEIYFPSALICSALLCSGDEEFSFETGRPHFETERLVRQSVINREEVDDGQLTQFLASNFEYRLALTFPVLHRSYFKTKTTTNQQNLTKTLNLNSKN